MTGEADCDLIGELAQALSRALDGGGVSEAAIIEVAMAQATQPGSDGIVAAATALRLLVMSEAARLGVMGVEAPRLGDVETWRGVVERVDRAAWFQAAGVEAKPLYDAAMARLLHTGGPTLRDVANEIAALPAPAVVAATVDFTCGFFDSPETAEMVVAFVALVDEDAERRLEQQLAPKSPTRG